MKNQLLGIMKIKLRLNKTQLVNVNHDCLVTEVRWDKSQSKSGISSKTIAEGEIVVGDINCPMTMTMWVGSQ